MCISHSACCAARHLEVKIKQITSTAFTLYSASRVACSPTRPHDGFVTSAKKTGTQGTQDIPLRKIWNEERSENQML